MSHFFAYMGRMRLIRRWGLMHSLQPENIQEHSLQVAMVAHALALIGNRYFGKNYNAEHIMALAVYHEAGEVLTGDLPTPIKYANPSLRDAYKGLEAQAELHLLEMLPQELREDYRPLVCQTPGEEHDLVKAADRLCAYLKCVEERRNGNGEFIDAEATLLASIRAMALPEAERFLAEYAPSFSLTLDKMRGGDL